MQTLRIVAPIWAAAGLVGLSAVSAIADELPIRKTGHWQIKTIAATIGTSTIEACIGPGDSIVASAGEGDCSTPEVKRAGDQVIVNITCPTKLGRETTSTLFTGDFKTWYRGTAKMTFDPPSNGMATLGFTLDARYIGPECPATEPGKQQ